MPISQHTHQHKLPTPPPWHEEGPPCIQFSLCLDKENDIKPDDPHVPGVEVEDKIVTSHTHTQLERVSEGLDFVVNKKDKISAFDFNKLLNLAAHDDENASTYAQNN